MLIAILNTCSKEELDDDGPAGAVIAAPASPPAQ
jgi:hypothetical protein